MDVIFDVVVGETDIAWLEGAVDFHKELCFEGVPGFIGRESE
jgi:hypothetical protein